MLFVQTCTQFVLLLSTTHFVFVDSTTLTNRFVDCILYALYLPLRDLNFDKNNFLAFVLWL